MTPKNGFFKPIFPHSPKKIERVAQLKKQPSNISKFSAHQGSNTPKQANTNAVRIRETGERVSTQSSVIRTLKTAKVSTFTSLSQNSPLLPQRSIRKTNVGENSRAGTLSTLDPQDLARASL